MRLAIGSYTATSAAGVGLAAMHDSIASRSSGLRLNDLQGCDLDTWIGRVEAVESVSLPAHLGYLQSRDNQLVWLGLQQDGFLESLAQLAERLGTDRAAIYAHEMAAIGAKTYREAAEPIIAADSADLTKWDHVMTVPMRFNRLILLRPWLWHAAGRSFGDSLQNGRLVQLFFFGLGEAPGGPGQGASQSRSA